MARVDELAARMAAADIAARVDVGSSGPAEHPIRPQLTGMDDKEMASVASASYRMAAALLREGKNWDQSGKPVKKGEK